jgi:hypothetical protein
LGDWPLRTSLDPFLLSVDEGTEGETRLTILKYSDYGVIIRTLFHSTMLWGQGIEVTPREA